MLYHATYKKNLSSIKRNGLNPSKSFSMWSDSKRDRVYLAKDRDVAESYAETSEELPSGWSEEDLEDIVVLLIDETLIDKEKIKLDENVIDNDGDTVEYIGVIPYSAIVNKNEFDHLKKRKLKR